MDVIPNALMAHLDILRQDLTFTARTLLRTPGFTLTAIVVAALGIGATTAAFSVTDRVLFRELPFGDSERLVSLYQAEPGYSRFEPSPSHYRDWKQMNTVFDDLGASASTSMNLIGDGEPLRVNGSWVTSNLFDILRVAPQVGRLFTPEEDMEGAPGTVILSYGLWVEAFGGADAAEAAATLAAERRAALQHHAAGLGAQVYAEKPKAFARRLRAYWKAWERSGHDLPGPV